MRIQISDPGPLFWMEPATQEPTDNPVLLAL